MYITYSYTGTCKCTQLILLIKQNSRTDEIRTAVVEWNGLILLFFEWPRKAFPGVNLKEVRERYILLTKDNVPSREKARTKTLRQRNG